MPINVEVLGGVPATTLASSIITGATSIPLASGTGFPDGTNGAFYIVIDRGLSTQEVVKCASRSGTTVTVASGGRGADGSTDQGHSSGATVEHVAAAEIIQALVDHADQTTGSPHGTAYLTPSGNAATASKWQSARTLALSGDVTGSNTIDGSGNVTITTAVVDDSHDHTSSITGSAKYLTVDANVTPQGASISGSPQTITTEADVTGATKTITTPRANMVYVVTGVFDLRIDIATVGETTTFLGILNVDGSNQTRKAIRSVNWAANTGVDRMTVMQSWVVVLGSATSHTLKLRAERLAGTATVRLYEHTNIDLVHAYG